MNDPQQQTSQAAPTGRQAAKIASAVVVGDVVGWGAVIALSLLFGSWLSLDSSALRDALVLVSASAVAGCVGWGWLARSRAGRPARLVVHRGLVQRVSVPAATVRDGALPGRLEGLAKRRSREVLTFGGAFAVIVVPLALGVGSPVLTGTAADLAAAGAVVRELRVESVSDVEEDEHKNGSTCFCTSTVTLPAADGNGPGARAEFRSEWADECAVGQRAFVAYAPDQPELGAIGDNERAVVDRQLDGRALSKWWTGILLLPVLGIVALVIGSAVMARRDERFPHPLQGDERVLRARITGVVRGGSGAKPLTLATDAGPVEFHAHVTTLAFARATDGTEGSLVWHPGRNPTGGRKGPTRIGAAFISDDGWYVHGAIEPQTAEGATATAVQGVPTDGARQARHLDLDAGWLLTIPTPLAQALPVWAGLLVLLALPIDLPGRVFVGILGSAGLLLFGGVIAMLRMDADEAAQRAGSASSS
ncbi:hypothetical protein [Streptomyces fulvoviolaceus]|nr:hypothetical protein [Streptomyces fulvoviolaceus]